MLMETELVAYKGTGPRSIKKRAHLAGTTLQGERHRRHMVADLVHYANTDDLRNSLTHRRSSPLRSRLTDARRLDEAGVEGTPGCT
ncbi:hypothetical protein GCM10009733_078490 [Nonomuraea maheshkhaliensis]|uniref:Uncharacterized protein n=1 Tax=Nonomuraea maheshkhaliensis TaxID=419590 RepID=A0ABN2GD97_9ACTN